MHGECVRFCKEDAVFYINVLSERSERLQKATKNLMHNNEHPRPDSIRVIAECKFKVTVSPVFCVICYITLKVVI